MTGTERLTARQIGVIRLEYLERTENFDPSKSDLITDVEEVFGVGRETALEAVNRAINPNYHVGGDDLLEINVPNFD